VTDKFKPIQNIPKTYEQFVLEDKQLTLEQQQYLYPELGYGDISIQNGYGPVEKWCSHCSANKDVSESSASCPNCGNAFGTVATRSKAQEQADRNTQVAAEKGGKSTYKCTTDKDGNTVETAEYTKQ